MGKFSEDAFKIASIACLLRRTDLPTRRNYIDAVRILQASQKALEFLEEHGSISGFELYGKTTFKELLHLNTTDTVSVNLGKVSTLRGLHDRIKKRFPSVPELERLDSVAVSNSEVDDLLSKAHGEWLREEVFRLVRAKESGLPSAKWDPYVHSDEHRSSEEIIRSGYVTFLERLALDQRMIDGTSENLSNSAE